MSAYNIISSDSHVIEPPDLWSDRIESRFRDQAPRVVSEDTGDWWYIEGQRTNSFQGGTQTGMRFEHSEELQMGGRWENVRPGGYIPDERIKDLEMDGVYGEVIYPTEGLLVYNARDSQALSAICRAYNDWIADFCSAYPDRLKGIALANVDDVQEAIRELERARKIGLVGAMITVYPPEQMSYNRPEYESFWAAAQNLDMPLSLHIATGRPGPGQEFQDPTSVRPAFFATADHWVRVSLSHMIFSGVFERYPKLKVVSVEHELAWAPFFLDQLDYTYTQRAPRGGGWHKFKGDTRPSDFFHRNVFLSFQEDGRGIRDRSTIGVDNLLWGSDYPHTESTFPRSRQILGNILEDVSEEQKAKICGGNTALLYHFS